MSYLALFLYSLIISMFLNNSSFSLGVNVSVNSATLFIPDLLFKSPKSKLSVDISRIFAILTKVSRDGVTAKYYLLDENNDMALVREEIFTGEKYSSILTLPLYGSYLITLGK